MAVAPNYYESDSADGKTADSKFGDSGFESSQCHSVVTHRDWRSWLNVSISTSVWSAQHPNAGRNIQQKSPRRDQNRGQGTVFST